ncbi:CIA30 family protein [Rhodoferax sp.]|uniref:CIA30 family protein n=1 Tax=Rhodoferax sp. TaxID=50421 RepID=UPI0026328457|nr:CIA30 family protein [Rhodoferax sp.]MDD2809443.1 CIA30 family protein [Rhodoferax sp.]
MAGLFIGVAIAHKICAQSYQQNSCLQLPNRLSNEYVKHEFDEDCPMPILIYHFDTPTSTTNWQAINDGVMGGASVSRLRFDAAGHAVFEGEVSLENNGGFASVRASQLNLGCADTVAYGLIAWGDGHTYKLNLRTDSGFDGVNYQAVFTPAPGQWHQTILPVTAFEPNFRGRWVSGAPALQPEAVKQVGLMISDKQAGAFRLLIQNIEALSRG